MINAIYETETGNIKTWIPEWFSTGVSDGLAISPLLDIEYVEDEKGYPVQDELPTNISEIGGVEVAVLKEKYGGCRSKALATLDPLVAQINRYTLLGQDASTAQVKLETAMAEINELFPVEVTYDYNESTGKYHLQSCQYCGDTLDLYTLAELAEFGATPCAVCNPPKYEGV